MYTIQENVRIVISLFKQYNVRHIVINPGGTNISVAQAIQDDPFFKCYSVPDERSAMYFAIGLHLQTGEVIATSCTSAQATRNYTSILQLLPLRQQSLNDSSIRTICRHLISALCLRIV